MSDIWRWPALKRKMAMRSQQRTTTSTLNITSDRCSRVLARARRPIAGQAPASQLYASACPFLSFRMKRASASSIVHGGGKRRLKRRTASFSYCQKLSLQPPLGNPHAPYPLLSTSLFGWRSCRAWRIHQQVSAHCSVPQLRHADAASGTNQTLGTLASATEHRTEWALPPDSSVGFSPLVRRTSRFGALSDLYSFYCTARRFSFADLRWVALSRLPLTLERLFTGSPPGLRGPS